MSISDNDKNILRALGEELSEIGSLSEQKDRTALWCNLNGLKPGHPLVWINEVPWHEMDVNSELSLQCENKSWQTLEAQLRRTIYQWRHFAADMVVDPVVYCPIIFDDTNMVIETNAVRSGADHGSADYVPIITCEQDVTKIKDPQVTIHQDKTDELFGQYCDIFSGIIEVKKQGIPTRWFSPWDKLCQWYGITELMMDMIDKPDLVRMVTERYVEAELARLDQYEQLGILSAGNGNHRVGCGGLGITDELPQDDFDGEHVRPMDQWGTATGQIFSEVSPEMHEEFCLQYERKYLERFGLNCYGCCEPLHHKMDLMRTIPRLRRISISPKADKVRAAEEIKTDYVYSLKPNPSLLAPVWDLEKARQTLKGELDQCRGCVIEIIMKDVTTVNNQPERLWQWAEMAVAGEY